MDASRKSTPIDVVKQHMSRSHQSQMTDEMMQLEKISLVRAILSQRGSRKDTSNDVAKSQGGKSKPEVHVREPTDGTKKKKSKSNKENQKKKKVKINKNNVSDDDTEPETFDCEYCLSNGHKSVIGFEKCAKWGCPECTDLPPSVHELIGKWGNLHWYCKICEVEVRHFCEKPTPSQPEEEENANKPTAWH